MTHPLVQHMAQRVKEPAAVTSVRRLQSELSEFDISRFWEPLPPPATAAVVTAAEARLGFLLPPLLAELYTTVANGGFGPGYGLIGLPGGFRELDDLAEHDGSGLDLVALYEAWQSSAALPRPPLAHDFSRAPELFLEEGASMGGAWFDKLLVLCNHGCWMLSCLDCSQENRPVVTYFGYEGRFKLAAPSFEAWIEAWLNDAPEF